MLKVTTCKTKRYYIKTYLALTNVPMWHYGFSPYILRILHYLDYSIMHFPPFLGPLPLLDTKLKLAFGPPNSPPLASNIEKEDISSSREGQTL